MTSGTDRSWLGWLAAAMAVAFIVFVFSAWLEPRNVSAWLGAWLRAFCT